MNNLATFNVRLKWVCVNGMRLLGAIMILLFTQAAMGQQGPLTPRTLNYPNMGGMMESLPQGYNSGNNTYPLLIAMHGIGEEGDGSAQQITRLTNTGIPKLINSGGFPASVNANGKSFSFIVLCPQFNGIPQEIQMWQLINYAKQHYRIDTTRMYLTGLSRGGGATWGFSSLNNKDAGTLAAIVPVAGNYDPGVPVADTIAANNLPVWAFHNDGDPTVPSDYSKRWVQYINAYRPAANPQARLTIFNVSGHDAWTKAYDPAYRENGKNIYEWMLQYTRGTAVSTPATPGRRITLQPNTGATPGFYYPNANTQLGVNPGDTLCIPPGDYTGMMLGNLSGTAAQPVVIINCGGLVRFGINNTSTSYSTTVDLENCRYVEFAGTGAPNLEYGFDILGSNSKGEGMFAMYWTNGSSDFDVHNIYIHNAGMFFVAKTTQDCATPQYWETGGYVMRNCRVHHLKCITSQYEGFYIGNSHYLLDLPCGNNIRSHHIENLEVYDNYLENTGSDGIQIGMAYDGNNKVHHNKVINYGTRHDDLNGYGILMNPGSRMEVYDNYLNGGYASGICFFGSGLSKAYNNVVANLTWDGFTVADRPVFDSVTAYVYNNTFINVTRAGTVYAPGVGEGHKFYNNVCVSPSGAAQDKPFNGYYIVGSAPIKYDYKNNLYYTNIADAKFVNPAAGDFHLQATSPLIDKGLDLSTTLGLKTDFDGVSRPQGKAFDAGAYEYRTGTGNIPPQANAGPDIVITLPVNSVTLDGSASMDPDGSIASYSWSMLNGPSTAVFNNATIAKPMVSGLVKGVYTFRLVVTDNGGLTDTATTTVTVQSSAGGKKPPVAIAGAAETIILPNNTINLDGSASYDPDGSIVSYSWTQIAGPASTILAPDRAHTSALVVAKGVYTYQLVVRDNDSLTGTATKQVKVIDPSDVHPPDDTTVTIRLYPNPTRDHVKLEINNHDIKMAYVTIYNTRGMAVIKGAYAITNTLNIDLNIGSLATGIYFVEVKGENNFKWVGRLLKL
ncbi:PKD domain-containing protein [Chitinophaga vietnamensis]|uniref:PKD domain-containing protein n=1 Tax=Chitinophaga vietnamensis TaxID=2593957 RepID=UPI0011788E60|nr:PKD domain-containing protein [Chitinophaga vietnamensis]